MTPPSWLVAIARLVVTLAVPILLVVSPLYLFISPAYVRFQYRREGFPPSSRFTPQERQRLSDVLVNYLRGRATYEEMAGARTDTGEVALRAKEVQHMVDVKRVTDTFFVAHVVAVAMLFIGGGILWRSSSLAGLAFALRWGVWVTGGLIALVLLSSIADFSSFFTRFHQLFFSAGSWLFYEEDTLIQLYPLVFWGDTVLLLGITILLETGILYALTIWLARAGGGKIGA
ncbi:MAG: TIGR01906 family membrane protein [Chloroflexi bacterium]|nr:TIGR01906 family membrane protein [Chloroflexota bacterium]